MGIGISSLHASPAIHLSAIHSEPSAQKPNAEAATSATPENSATVNATVTAQDSQSPRSEEQGAHQQRQQKTLAEKNNPIALDEQEKKQVESLRKRDIEVRAHEAAHLAAAGQHAKGGAKFDLTRGPDGRSYAIGGHVSIDTSREPTPEATIRKADQIKRAAMAPAEPSGQDRAVAAEAMAMKLEAQAELAALDKDERSPEPTTSKTDSEKTAFASTQPEQEKESPATSTLSCSVCGGAHSTDSHVASNQNKLTSYTVQDQQPQRLMSAIA